MDDLISRQAVKELAHNQVREKYCGMAFKKQRDFYIKLADSIIDLLPAVHPEPHWIPVTERLPDNSRNVLITSKGEVSMAWYNGSYFEKGASTHHRKMKTVTAWCELPEPYKEQRHE